MSTGRWWLAIALGCSDAEPRPCAVTFSPHELLRGATELAAARWAAATGCAVEVGPGGVPVELALRITRPDGSQAPGMWHAGKVSVHGATGAEQRARTILHELGHALGMQSERCKGCIDPGALAEVCSALPCRAFEPECHGTSGSTTPGTR